MAYLVHLFLAALMYLLMGVDRSIFLPLQVLGSIVSGVLVVLGYQRKKQPTLYFLLSVWFFGAFLIIEPFNDFETADNRRLLFILTAFLSGMYAGARWQREVD